MEFPDSLLRTSRVLGSEVQGLGLRVYGLVFRIQGLGLAQP